MPLKTETIMKFAIIGKKYQSDKLMYVEHLLALLRHYKAKILVEKSFANFLKQEKGWVLPEEEMFEGKAFSADMVISLGGDGTFLKAASLVGNRNIPILGINPGRLGFLADILPEEMDVTIDEIYANHYKIEERAVLQLTSSQPLSIPTFALNEVAILKHDSSSMISIKAFINREHLNTYQADGLIIATPTGSTGYSLSVGGPVIAPQRKTMVISPIAPHSLNCRPLVVRDDWEITLEVGSRSHNFLVSVDGKSESCDEQTRLRITRAPYTIKLVKRFDHQYFNTLRSKMMWGADAR